MVHPRLVNSGFTMIELLTTILIIAALIVGALVSVGSIASWAQQTADRQTLTLLNDALTRYKCGGGTLSALTQNAPIGHVLTKMATTINWCGMNHMVMQKGVTYPARSLTAIGTGATYQFTKFNSYQAAFDSSIAILGALSAQGTPPDAATPAWVATSLATTGNAPYLVLSQPSSSLLIGMNMRGIGTLCVNWGDGNTQNYTLSGSNTAVMHTYTSPGNYGVTMIGNVTYMWSNSDAPLGGAGCTAFGGDISTMKTLTYVGIFGTNTISGSVSNLTLLTYFDVEGLNTISGSITNLTGMTLFRAFGNNTLSGSVVGMTSLQYIAVGAANTITGWETAAANTTGLSYLYQRGTVLTSAQVNAVLAGFWANRNAAKPRATERGIYINNPGNGAPTGQGITDKANLQAYLSPNGTGPMVWSVTTN
jgi:prepilin-type N-terminal cleavage/methylation domain-containing protein